ncbi:MAG: hypothetical protein M3N95_17820 [Actinomycetota bacterium]|nr:hypothetical protein [Actinomycetota bacterium]
MQRFSGVQPLVGDIVGLRTFRVDDSGLLLPLYSDLCWYDGANTATCAPPTGERVRERHQVPSPECECGFYVYGTQRAAMQHRHTRYVQAVVSCWGTIVAGTQGVRAEHARIDAIWLHPNVPRWVRQRLASRYPSARLYADRCLMLDEHPLSRLDCYQDCRKRRSPSRCGGLCGVAGVLALGLVPGRQLEGSSVLWLTWLLVTVATGLLAGWLLVGVHSVGHRAAALLALGLLAWLLAPVFGVAGWLLRLPFLRGAAIVTGGYVLSLRPGFFPIDHTPRERAFCGVRA